MPERKIPKHRMPSPAELETRNSEIIARRSAIIDYAKSVPDDELCPGGWTDNVSRRLFGIDYSPDWRIVDDPWEPGSDILATAVVIDDDGFGRWFGVFELKPDESIRHVGSVFDLDSIPVLQVAISHELGRFDDAHWGGENAKKFLDIAEDLIISPDDSE